MGRGKDLRGVAFHRVLKILSGQKVIVILIELGLI